MQRFQVDRYEVRTELRRVNTSAGIETYAARTLVVFSTPEPSGGLTQALLYFSTLFDPWYNRAIVGQLETDNHFCTRVSVWLPISEFEPYYEILLNERPLFFYYQTGVAFDTRAYLEQVALTSCDVYEGSLLTVGPA
ncbi:MAG: hypothetical protein IPK66_03145 [Rhodospirillales bacterium]|nr:hypothetical protein [Rhodospirillales bacterium]